MAKARTGTKDGGIVETIKTVVYAIAIAVVFRSLLFQPFWIPSGSMKPTLLIGDYIFVSKFAYGVSKHSFPFSLGPFNGRLFGSEPERGDVIVFRHPRNNEDFVKRLIGMPGERIQMRDGVLHINDEPVGMTRAGEFVEPIVPGVTSCSERRSIGGEVMCVKELWIETLPNGVEHVVLNADNNRLRGTDRTATYTVPEGHYFFMGDNRDNSNDSRQGVGMVPYENLLGRAEIIAISSDGPFYELWNWRFDRFFELVR